MALGACSSSDAAAGDTPIYLDSASDEAFEVFRAAVEDGKATADATRAAVLTAPTYGQTVANMPFTFSWSFPDESLAKPHGVDTGRFVWLALSGSGPLAGGLDVVALSSTSWTPDADAWEKIAGGGAITARIYTATLLNGQLTQGPFSSAFAMFSVAP